jgi:phage/plasmid-associated DNA primase
MAADLTLASSVSELSSDVRLAQSDPVVRLVGARLVTAIETEEGRAWAESKLKAITGGDEISARLMRKDFFGFTPRFKLMIAGNHKP